MLVGGQLDPDAWSAFCGSWDREAWVVSGLLPWGVCFPPGPREVAGTPPLLNWEAGVQMVANVFGGLARCWLDGQRQAI